MDNKMQEEAMRRVREMQSGNMPDRTRNHQRKTSEENPSQTFEKPEQIISPPEKSDPLSGLFKDKEKLLILLLIMLLSEESTNTELVLALLYIII